MNLSKILISSLAVLVIAGCADNAKEGGLMTAEEGGYTYKYAPNDASKTRIYTLENGLKVYLSVYKEEPRIQTLIPVKAGGKFDPSSSTGLAHYLEHMMFKGTHKFGTKDWEKESVLVDSIENMFEHYRSLTDEEKRKEYYQKIDSVSNQASEFAIANEYDKMMAFIGAKRTNAYTTEDRTVYMNDIPANQLENFIQIEAERFSTIVNRLFHTELEAVYEEKNRSLDNDRWKVQERLMGHMFKQHPYGTQTVIGTIEHLKNPSIKDINAYFAKYYVPNNMAICMSGDLDPTETIKLIDTYFGDLQQTDLETYRAPQEEPIQAAVEDTVYGPDSEFLSMGFRVEGTADPDFVKLKMVDMILSNSAAGLIDLNLVQKQKILSGVSYVNAMNDFSIHQFRGEPRDGQSLTEVKDLLLEQIEILKNGEFEDWLIEAVINDFKKNKMRSLESNWARASDMVMAFTNELSWADYTSRIAQMEKVTKAELVQYVKDNYKDNYAVVYKMTGEDPNKIQVEKPSITKVALDRSSTSDFYQQIQEREVPEIKPVFVNYEEDITKRELREGVPVLSKVNTENELFTLYYLYEFGTNEDPRLDLAMNYLKYLGTEEMAPEEVKKEFYRLGADFNVFSSNERIYVTLSGLTNTMGEAVDLFESLLNEPVPNDDVLSNLISDTFKERSDAKKNKSEILWGGLMNYATYGSNSPFTNVISNQELDNMKSEDLIQLIKSLSGYEHKVMYYGPMPVEELTGLLKEKHQLNEELSSVPPKVNFAKLDTEDPKVFYTPYDMVQAEIIFQSRGPEYNSELAPEVRLFNEYFGGGMSSIVFQELREAQGLAYSVFSSYQQGDKLEENDNMMAYIGTQADKQKEAMNALIDLINNVPESDKNFETAKKSILKKIESERITKTSVLFNYLSAQRKGLDHDIRKDIYEKVNGMTFEDIMSFHNEYIKDKKYNVAIIGDEDKLDFVALGEYGEVKKLSLDELFGYSEQEKIQKM